MTTQRIDRAPSHTPQRIQLSRAKGFQLQPVSLALNGLAAVNVARPSRWGNPFRVGGWFMVGDPRGKSAGLFEMAWCETSTPEEPGFTLMDSNDTAVRFFERYAAQWVPSRLNHAREHLRGRNLACWCKPDQSCHADALLRLANQEP